MITLSQLVEQDDAYGVVITDAGKGSIYPEEGVLLIYDDRIDYQYGGIAMHAARPGHYSIEGIYCVWESDWIVYGHGEDAYRVKFYF